MLKQSARTTLIEIYREWFNGYLTLETFAEHNGLTIKQAQELITLARELENSKHPEE